MPVTHPAVYLGPVVSPKGNPEKAEQLMSDGAKAANRRKRAKGRS